MHEFLQYTRTKTPNNIFFHTVTSNGVICKKHVVQSNLRNRQAKEPGKFCVLL